MKWYRRDATVERGSFSGKKIQSSIFCHSMNLQFVSVNQMSFLLNLFRFDMSSGVERASLFSFFWSIGSSKVEMKIKYFLCSVLFARLRGDGWMGGKEERREQSTRNPYNSGTVNDDSRQREATHWHFYRCMIFMRKCINIRLMPWFLPPHLIHLLPARKTWRRFWR